MRVFEADEGGMQMGTRRIVLVSLVGQNLNRRQALKWQEQSDKAGKAR